MPGGGPHSFLASSRSFAPHTFCWCRWGQREEGSQEHGFAAHLQALASPQGAVKPLRWDKGAIEPWDTGLLLEKTLAVLQAPSLSVIPCTTWSSANHLPANARAGEASQQGGKGAVGQTDVCYRAGPRFTGRSWSHHTNLSLVASPHPPGTSLMQGTQQPGTTTVCQERLCHSKPCKDSCSSEVLWARLCWMQVRTFVLVRALPSACCLPLHG